MRSLYGRTGYGVYLNKETIIRLPGPVPRPVNYEEVPINHC